MAKATGVFIEHEGKVTLSFNRRQVSYTKKFKFLPQQQFLLQFYGLKQQVLQRQWKRRKCWVQCWPDPKKINSLALLNNDSLLAFIRSDEIEEVSNENYSNTSPHSMQFISYPKEGKDYYAGNVARVRISLWTGVKQHVHMKHQHRFWMHHLHFCWVYEERTASINNEQSSTSADAKVTWISSFSASGTPCSLSHHNSAPRTAQIAVLQVLWGLYCRKLHVLCYFYE